MAIEPFVLPNQLNPQLLSQNAATPTNFPLPHDLRLPPLPPPADIAGALRGGLEFGSRLAPEILNAPVAASARQTELLKQGVSQDYLKGVKYGTPQLDANGNPALDANGQPIRTFSPANISIGPGGATITTPSQFLNRASFNLGAAPVYGGAAPGSGAPASGGPINAINRAAADMGGGAPAPATPSTPDTAPTTESLGKMPDQSSAIPIPTSPIAVDSTQRIQKPTTGPFPPADVLDWFKTTVDSRAKYARAEMGPNGQPTGRTEIGFPPATKQTPSMMPQMVHPEYMIANLGGWTPSNAPAISPNPVIAGGLPGAPTSPSELLAQGKLTAQQIAQSGTPLSASSGSGPLPGPQGPLPGQPAQPVNRGPVDPNTGWTLDPSQFTGHGTPTAGSVPATGGTIQGIQRPQPTTAVGPPSSPDATNKTDVRSLTGFPDLKSFGQVAFNPTFQVAAGIGKGPTSIDSSGKPVATSDWHDVNIPTNQGGDGRTHRLYVDPSISGGRMDYSSSYFRSGVVGAPIDPQTGQPDPNASGFHEHRLYLDGHEEDVNNQPLEAELNQMGNLATKWGTIPKGSVFAQLPRNVQEGAYRDALQFENTKPLESDDDMNVKNLWEVMQLGDKQRQLVNTMGPKDHDDVAQYANEWAMKHGARTPNWLADPVKQFTGLDIQNPNQKFSDLANNHSVMASAVRRLTASPRWNAAGEEHLDTMIGDPLNQNYGGQLDNFMNTYIYPAAHRAASMAYSKMERLPPEFAAAQSRKELGDNNVPGGSQANPIIVKSQEQEDKAAKGDWLVDKRGVPYQKDW